MTMSLLEALPSSLLTDAITTLLRLTVASQASAALAIKSATLIVWYCLFGGQSEIDAPVGVMVGALVSITLTTTVSSPKALLGSLTLRVMVWDPNPRVVVKVDPVPNTVAPSLHSNVSGVSPSISEP